jgi:hypothetical protein
MKPNFSRTRSRDPHIRIGESEKQEFALLRVGASNFTFCALNVAHAGVNYTAARSPKLSWSLRDPIVAHSAPIYSGGTYETRQQSKLYLLALSFAAPSTWSISWIVMMFRWLSRGGGFGFLDEAPLALGIAHLCAGRNLSATYRSRRVSRAFQNTPIPP